MSINQPTKRITLLAKHHAQGLQQEISTIQQMDAKAQQDIRNLRERLKMANCEECPRCTNYLQELR
jgi:nitrate/TMAO reductase-like tetraheme cytochrome c subunit